VVLDTSVYIEHDEKLDSALHLTPFQDKRLHLLVPMVVIDELDGTKTKARGPNGRAPPTRSAWWNVSSPSRSRVA
jgi:hypothetical protein